MNVLVAEEMGMCFGVRDALKVLDGITNPREVTIHGQLVHNEVVLQTTDNSRIPHGRGIGTTATAAVGTGARHRVMESAIASATVSKKPEKR